jgi:hypothetical protein
MAFVVGISSIVGQELHSIVISDMLRVGLGEF